MIGDGCGKQHFARGSTGDNKTKKTKLMGAFLTEPLLLMILGGNTGITSEIQPKSTNFSPLISIMKLSHEFL